MYNRGCKTAERRRIHTKNFAIVGFCDEEGMRFGTGYFGSGAMLDTEMWNIVNITKIQTEFLSMML